jgi:Flp pilus assembly protein TadG
MALPITMMVFTGIFAVAIAISNDVALNVAVEAGARYMATEGKATGTNMATLADPCQSIFSQMVASSTTLNPANITVTYTLNGSTIGPYTGTAANTCSSQSTAFSEGGNLTLVATYPCTIGMYGFNFSGCQITAAASQFIYTS